MLNRDDIKALLVLVISIALIVVAVRFFIYLLPFIIVGLLILLAYDSYKSKKFFWQRNGSEKKENNIKEAQVLKEKNND